MAQAAKIADSLRVLPTVRLEAAAWRNATDSARASSAANGRAAQSLQRALDAETLLTLNETAKADDWKQKARRRGLLNYLGLALAGAAVYLLIIR